MRDEVGEEAGVGWAVDHWVLDVDVGVLVLLDVQVLRLKDSRADGMWLLRW